LKAEAECLSLCLRQLRDKVWHRLLSYHHGRLLIRGVGDTQDARYEGSVEHWKRVVLERLNDTSKKVLE